MYFATMGPILRDLYLPISQGMFHRTQHANRHLFFRVLDTIDFSPCPSDKSVQPVLPHRRRPLPPRPCVLPPLFAELPLEPDGLPVGIQQDCNFVHRQPMATPRHATGTGGIPPEFRMQPVPDLKPIIHKFGHHHSNAFELVGPFDLQQSVEYSGDEQLQHSEIQQHNKRYEENVRANWLGADKRTLGHELLVGHFRCASRNRGRSILQHINPPISGGNPHQCKHCLRQSGEAGRTRLGGLLKSNLAEQLHTQSPIHKKEYHDQHPNIDDDGEHQHTGLHDDLERCCRVGDA
mmetsp:Transcript_136483/g.308422  ORF Transcript_136483/g.308422 Transcript_136483/m.308422 type:complete len:292 (-) Transcript_136483:72-947(-)